MNPSFCRRRMVQATGAAALLASLGQRVAAQAGVETLKFVTGFAAGGTSDTICRRVATRMSPGYAKLAVVEANARVGQPPEAVKPEDWGITVLGPDAAVAENYVLAAKRMRSADGKETVR